MFVQSCRVYKNITTFNITKDELPHIHFLRTLPRLSEHLFSGAALNAENVK